MNESEKQVAETLEKRGFTVLRNGWPDFLVLNEKKAIAFAVEVKSGNDTLSSEQKEMHRVLEMLGLPVYVSKNGDVGRCQGVRILTNSMVHQLMIHINDIKTMFNYRMKEIAAQMHEVEGRLLRVQAAIHDEPLPEVKPFTMED